MSLFSRRVVLFGMVMLVTVSAGWCGTFSDPSGFSFTYPDDWVAVTRDGVAEINAGMPSELKDMATRFKVDFDRITMALIRNGQDEFLENLNVIVDKQQIPVNAASAKKYVEMLGQQYSTMGINVENMQGRVQRFGANEAIVVEYRAQMPGVDGTLWQQQVLIPGGGKSFVVTCTAKAESFERYRATFDQILASFTVPAPISQGFNWGQLWMTTLTGASVGAITGALFWVFQQFTRRKRAPQDDAEIPQRDDAPTD